MNLKAWAKAKLLKWSKPTQEELVKKIISQIAGLELLKEESIKLRKYGSNMYGVVEVRGNALPSFHFTVFDEPLMEFVHVRCDLGLPSKLSYYAEIREVIDNALIAKETPMKDFYKEEFEELLQHLFNYFAFPEKEHPNEPTKIF